MNRILVTMFILLMFVFSIAAIKTIHEKGKPYYGGASNGEVLSRK